MRRCLLVITCILFLVVGCASQEAFIESNKIKGFPIPETAINIDTQEEEGPFQYQWKNIKASLGIPKSFHSAIGENGWELDTEKTKDQEYYFTKHDRTVKIVVEEGAFILSEVENLPNKRDEEGNYLLNYQVIFQGNKDKIFFENTLEQNAADWFLNSLEEFKNTPNKEHYFYKQEGNIYEYLVVTGGQKVKNIYINEGKTRIVVELVEEKDSEDEIQFLKYKSFYPNIKITATTLVEK